MAYESTPPHGAGRQKTRSASISAPSSASLETILNPPSSNGTPDIGYQRRRPATRTQSARITGARSVSWTWERRTENAKPNEWMNEWMHDEGNNKPLHVFIFLYFHVNCLYCWTIASISFGALKWILLVFWWGEDVVSTKNEENRTVALTCTSHVNQKFQTTRTEQNFFAGTQQNCTLSTFTRSHESPSLCNPHLLSSSTWCP